MSLDQRLREGLKGLDALETLPSKDAVDGVLLRGRRQRWVRRITTACVAVAATIASVVVVPKALERGSGEPRPARPVGTAGIITTLAGTGTAWSSGDGGPATEADIEYPVDLAFDGEGNLFFLELGDPSNPQRVRKVDPAGQITTVVGPGAGGEASRVVLSYTAGATGLAVDQRGNVYVGGDEINKVIKVDPTGDVTTVAGTGQPGFSGDNGPATDAELKNIWDLSVDLEGNLYIAGSSRIRRVDTRGVITTIVGTGKKGFSGDGGPALEAEIDRVTGVATDAAGRVYFIDLGNGRIRRIDTQGIITTIAGPGTQEGNECFFGEGVPAEQAIFCGPEHLWVDDEGSVFVADTYNHRIRMIDTNGIITTVAGSGMDGYSGDGGSALKARLSEPSSVAVGPDGAIYIADSGNNRVREVIH